MIFHANSTSYSYLIASGSKHRTTQQHQDKHQQNAERIILD